MIINYDKVRFIELIPTGGTNIVYSVRIIEEWEKRLNTKNKFAFINTTDCTVPNITLNNYLVNWHESYNEMCLYIHPQCFTPRIVLKEHFKTTNKKEKADVIIIPNKLHLTNETTTQHIFYAEYSRILILCNILQSFNGLSSTSNNCNKLIAVIKEKLQLQNELITILRTNDEKTSPENLSNKRIWFIPDIEEYKLILSRKVEKHIAFETCLSYPTPVQITPNTLWMWYNSNDNLIFEKSLAASNWNQYPFTILMLLMYKQNYMQFSKSTKDILKALNMIKFMQMYYVGDESYEIKPKDLKMFYGFICALLNIKNITDPVSDYAIMKLPNIYRKVLPAEIKLKEINTDKSINIQDLKQTCFNNFVSL